MTIVKFTQHSDYTYYYTDWDGDMSGEYVPLAEYQALQAQYRELGDSSNDAIQSLVKQRSKLKALIQRVVEIGPNLSDSLRWSVRLLGATEGYKSPELDQLLLDCQEVV